MSQIDYKERMRPFAALVLTAVCLRAQPAEAQQSYAAVLLQYLTGDADAAVTKLMSIDREEIQAGIDAFETTRSPQVLTGAAAMHTEAALKTVGGGLGSGYHLQVATALVEFGEHRTGKSNSSMSIHPRFAAPVSDDFRRLWYCTVINSLQAAALYGAAQRYLDHAVSLFPDNGEVQLLAGMLEEMRASPRTSATSAGDRRKALVEAERHFRAVLAVDAGRLEAQLRLGRVLQQRNELAEARRWLVPLTTAPDDRLAYLADLFLGGVEDASQHADAALADYQRAAARLPSGQTARLAASELLHRGGDRAAAAEAIASAAGPSNSSDPWWTYIFGEFWRRELLVAALRGMRHA
jgi:tetratricopeptide (TPR) repeat protein